MLKSVEGVYRDGRVELLEPAPEVAESRVLVTFLPSRSPITLEEKGIGLKQASDLRARLRAFAEDWSRPEMDVYDDL